MTDQSPDDILILGPVRTAIGDFGGALKSFAAAELGAKVMAEAVRRAGLEPHDLGHVVMGQVIPSSGKDAYLARAAALKAGCRWKCPRSPSTGCAARAFRRSFPPRR
jgi:acetyl-CoA C-acetyltransferase